MNIQSEIQKSIALLRQAEDLIIENKENNITNLIWTVRVMMDSIHYQLHSPESSSLNQR